MAEEQIAPPDRHQHHVLPVSVYLKVYVALVVLMALTVWAAQKHLGALNNTVAMSIAIAKAVLVVLYFMGVRFNTRLTWLWASIGFVWLMLLFGTLTDYITRDWIKVPGWPQ
jgi:cytochrome c oxidase subunit 4